MFIKERIAFTNKIPDVRFGPPGVIDNTKLEQVLVIDEKLEVLKKDRDYFLVSEDLWYFFLSIYGGGPTIMKNTHATNSNTSQSDECEIQSMISSLFSQYGKVPWQVSASKSKKAAANTQ